MRPSATLYDRIQIAAQAAAERLDADGTEVAVVLGSGLAPAADSLDDPRVVPYASLPGFPETTVAGHPGRLMVGRWQGRKVLVLCGRVHAYEGYCASEVGFALRVAATLGAHSVVITNVSGAVDPSLEVGEIVAISDHVNLTGASPLMGPNDERLGPRFVDMVDAYTPSLRALAGEVAQTLFGKNMPEAVYAGMPGPSYETPAEVRMLRILGVGLVGMSTIHEVISARHAGLSVLGLSLVANPAAGVKKGRLSHEEVTRAASAGAGRMGELLASVVGRIPGAGQTGPG
jgi:purine-nucleoside phosphorylase